MELPHERRAFNAAVRYVERNPAAKNLVTDAVDWRWSSARSHVAGKRIADDPLTDRGSAQRDQELHKIIVE